jgi:hypothetical protein
MTRPTLEERILDVFASEPRPDWGFYQACDLIALGCERNWGEPWQDYEPTLMRLVKDGRLRRFRVRQRCQGDPADWGYALSGKRLALSAIPVPN